MNDFCGASTVVAVNGSEWLQWVDWVEKLSSQTKGEMLILKEPALDKND
jgi:hypothetical protein